EDCDGIAQKLYKWKGVKTNVAIKDLDGWTRCFLDLYSDSGEAIPPQDCDKKNLLLGCRETGSDTLLVAAEAPTDDVETDTGKADGGHDTHSANGVAWYFRSVQGETGSWGFVPDGESPDKNECDTAEQQADDRLCWHTQDATFLGGWRCGSN